MLPDKTEKCENDWSVDWSKEQTLVCFPCSRTPTRTAVSRSRERKQESMAKYIAMGVAALFATAEGVDLTPANYEAEVKGSKNAFVKFLAPWCVPPTMHSRWRGAVAGR